MHQQRRRTLALLGGGLIAAVVAPSAGFLATRTPTKALKPWELAGSYEDARLRALSYALLAPNPHNRQPWIAELVGSDTVIVHRDKSLNLPVTDPEDRQLTIGMGCFLELMELAAAEEHIAVNTQLFPEGEEGPVAICSFVADAAQPNPLFEHVLIRRSHKEAFEPKLVSENDAEPLQQYADVFLEGSDRDTLRAIARDAWIAEVRTPTAWKESNDLVRIGKAEINANPDGIDVGGPLLDSLALFGLLDKEASLDITNPSARAVIEQTATAIQSAPAITLIRTDGNERQDQIQAGRLWLKLNLTTAGLGMALRPVSQALQEYPEVSEQYNDIHAKFAKNGETIHMLGLLGYGELTPRTPRWPLDARMKTSDA